MNPGHFKNVGEENDNVSGKPFRTIENQYLVLAAEELEHKGGQR